MTAEIIEGEAVEVGMTVVDQQVERLDETATPEGMVALAARMATALADIVEQKRLYATIQGKKYPQVEAWMTIGRMDNVAAREVRGGITRVEGGGFEAEVELIRLSDGMIVGYGSAMCGTPGDNPWTNRPVHTQRSMAVTRATSRAFRQRYSWIMALAGYEPTPADEMPDERGETHQPGGSPQTPRSGFVGTEAHPAPDLSKTPADGLIGTAVADGKYDFNLRQTPDGWRLPFRVKDGSKSFIAMAHDALAEALMAIKPTVLDQRVTVWGWWSDETIPKKGAKPEIRYRILHVDRIQTPDGTLPMVDAVEHDVAAATMPNVPEMPPLFGEGDMAALDAELGA